MPTAKAHVSSLFASTEAQAFAEPQPPASPASRVLGDSASGTSILAWSSWRQRESWAPKGPKNSDASNATAEGRLATAAIYAGAAMNANTLGWGATARAAEAAARQKYTTESKKCSGDPDRSSNPGLHLECAVPCFTAALSPQA